MPGCWITVKQVEIYMSARHKGDSQIVAASKAVISERRGRDIEHGIRVEPRCRERSWRTRPDPLSQVWADDLEPLLAESPGLQPITLLEYLQVKYPGAYPDNLLRTLQRRVKHWKATTGPDKAVIFRQSHPPGALGLSDFTQLKTDKVTINGEPFKHLLYHFRLACSGWSYLHVIQGGESFAALSEGLQSALWQLGGVPLQHRTDHLSAAYKNLCPSAQDDLTQSYEKLCAHYGLQATTNNPGVSHENGSIESPHGHLKRRIAQAFMLRGSHNFASIDDYQQWLTAIVNTHNQRNAKSITEERKHLQALPANYTQDYTVVNVKVSRTSTITVRCVLYSVPSRLIHEVLSVRLYDKQLVCFLGRAHVLTLARVYPDSGKRRARNINYQHVIHSLVKKPQAFRNSQFRDDLLPSDIYKAIWHYVDKVMSSKDACRFMVKLLALAASSGAEIALGAEVSCDIHSHTLKSIDEYQMKYSHAPVATMPTVTVHQHALTSYNDLTSSQGENTCQQ